jgi:hypothetical protein
MCLYNFCVSVGGKSAPVAKGMNWPKMRACLDVWMAPRAISLIHPASLRGTSTSGSAFQP